MEIFEKYEEKLEEILKNEPKEKSFINATTHMYGYFKKDLSKEEKRFFENTIEEYRDERIPLSVIIKILESWAIKYKKEYILKQTIINPYPKKLIEITDSGKGRNK